MAQVIHIPTLNHLNEYFRITYLCDVSQQALEFCASKVSTTSSPKLTKDAAELCRSPDVDVVMVVNSTEYHATHAVMALAQGRHVFIEKPMALNGRDAAAILGAELDSKGTVMVGYMRRYASAYADAIKEVGDLDQITYARVRDIIGHNSFFVSQSGTFPKRFSDYAQANVDDKARREAEMMELGLHSIGVPVTKDSKAFWHLLGSLGSHDISAMRELLGMPQGVLASHFNNDTQVWGYDRHYCSWLV